MKDLEELLHQRSERYQQDLFELLRIPSVSTDPDGRQDVRRAAEWLLAHFRQMGLPAELLETRRHPLIIAETLPVPNKPVALVYGHYDVQPPDPVDAWQTPPFEPSVRDGNVYARGATDDKGQMLTHVKSVQTWLEGRGELPMQVKFLIEGEEEVGSASLHHQLPGLAERLRSDVVVISDMSQFAAGCPGITYGLRGIAYFELRVRGPEKDLHSGTFGGAVANPANALARILSQIVADDGTVQVPGFYDHVVPLEADERDAFADLPFDEAAWKRQIGVSEVAGEAGYTTLERKWARPTYDVHGLCSGYQGVGAKTVLPAEASAKFSFRLVPDQHPGDIEAKLRVFLSQACPPGIEWELEPQHGGAALLTSRNSPMMAAASHAIELGFGKRPVLIREGGSIPVASALHACLNAEILLLGWGLDDDNTHSPNEKFSLADFRNGTQASLHLWDQLGRIER